MSELATVTTLRTDAMVAQEIRDEIEAPIREICRIMDKARSSGMHIQFQFINDQFGRHRVPEVLITKPL